MRKMEDKKYFTQIYFYQTRDTGVEKYRKIKKMPRLSPADNSAVCFDKLFPDVLAVPLFSTMAMTQETPDKIFLTGNIISIQK